jgi:hypothetical protein
MYIAIVKAANGEQAAGHIIAVFTDELGHGPRFERGPVRPKARIMSDEDADEFTLALPEPGQ